MSFCGKENDVIVISDDSDDEDADDFRTLPSTLLFSQAKNILSYRKALDLFADSPRLSFSQPSHERNKQTRKCRFSEELPDISVPFVRQRPSLSNLKNRKEDEVLWESSLKRLIVPLVRCDTMLDLKSDDPSSQNPNSEVLKEELSPKITSGGDGRSPLDPADHLHQQKTNLNSTGTPLRTAHLEQKKDKWHKTRTRRFESHIFDSTRSKKQNTYHSLKVKSFRSIYAGVTGKKRSLNARSKQAGHFRKALKRPRDRSPDAFKTKVPHHQESLGERISMEQQAVSSPCTDQPPVISFHQPPPERKEIPFTRISCQRQAFSSPLKVSIKPWPQDPQGPDTYDLQTSSPREQIVDKKAKVPIQICHRTIKRKTKFPEEIDADWSNPVIFNQTMNLEKNRVFGPYGYAYMPFYDMANSKKTFTVYHDGFVEAALELEDDPIGEALDFIKDFQSKRCPTENSIADIVYAWKTSGVHQNTNIACVMFQVLQRYPERARECVETHSLPFFISGSDTEDTMCSLLLASLELDLLTRTLCDKHSIRRSLSHSVLSWNKNQKNIEDIVRLVEMCIRYVKRTTQSSPSKKDSRRRQLSESNVEKSLPQKCTPPHQVSLVPTSECSQIKVGMTRDLGQCSILDLERQQLEQERAGVAKNVAKTEVDTVNKPKEVPPATISPSKKRIASPARRQLDDLPPMMQAEESSDPGEQPREIEDPESSAQGQTGAQGDRDRLAATLDAHSLTTRLFQMQRLLALGVESNLFDKENAVDKMASLLQQTYRRLSTPLQRRLLLGSLACPLLTSALAWRLLEGAEYLVVRRCHETMDTPFDVAEEPWTCSFQSSGEFCRRYTNSEQEEFSVLLYYAVWGSIESSKHRQLESRYDRLLNIGLALPRVPRNLMTCARQAVSMTTELPAHVGATTRHFLDLTSCLLQATSKEQVNYI